MKRRNVAIGVLIIASFLLGIFIKNIRAGLLIGLLLGILIGVFSRFRR